MNNDDFNKNKNLENRNIRTDLAYDVITKNEYKYIPSFHETYEEIFE